MPEDRLAMATGLVREARRIVDGQRLIIERRKVRGLATAEAEALLQTFEKALATFEDELAAINAEIKL